MNGRLAAAAGDGAVVEVGGLGIGVHVSATSARKLPPIGQTVRLATHLVVREDALELFGFADDDERRLFEQLISVSGVGPRMALSICSVGEPDALRLAIVRGDTATIQRASGVGKRTAERVVIDLRDRLGASEAAVTGASADGPAPSADLYLSARDALVSLGFKAEEADAALASAPAASSAEDLIRHGLSQLRRS